MTIFIKNNNELVTNSTSSITCSLDNNTFNISFYPSVEDEENVFNYTVTSDELKSCSLTQNIISDFSIVCVYKNEDDELSHISVLDKTQLTKPTGFKFSNALGIGRPVVLIGIPYADSNVDDFVIMFMSNNVVLNGNELASSDNDSSNTISAVANLMQGISLSYADNTITATLSEAKEGVSIYLENTCGTLGSNRIVTNSEGVATTSFTHSESGKIKAGFKHYSGVAELVVS